MVRHPRGALPSRTQELSASLPAESLGALSVGAVARFAADDGAEAGATVVALLPADDGQVLVRLSADSPVTAGAAYVLTFDNPAAQPAPQLLAPVAALVARGGAHVVTVRDGEEFREVDVEVLDVTGGLAAIRPLPGTAAGPELRAGTEVRLA